VHTGEVPERFSREMGYTRREFVENLKAALGSDAFRCRDGTTIEVPLEPGRVVIRLGEERRRRIASLSMPYMAVDFCFENLDADSRKVFFTAFQRSFQKGGG
jgi:hypothetical protein